MTGLVLRPELPADLPNRMTKLPVDRGYPVPWFAAWLDEHGNPQPRGVGTPDFRVVYPGAVLYAHQFSRCWVCGGGLGRYRAFVIGPMCAVNRTSSEPPCHVDCADWSARACPFLVRPHMVRREAGMPEEAVEPSGTMLRRNPGVAMVWTTTQYKLRAIPDEVLFWIGYPESVAFYTEGRPSTRDEVMHSITTGLPALRDLADAQGGRAPEQLEKMLVDALELVPMV